MIKDNKIKIFSMSGICFIAKLHDDNFATITMNGILKIFLGKKPFNCIRNKQITKTTEIYNIKEISIQNGNINISNIEQNNINNPKTYLIFYAKDILIYSFENKYQKCFLVQKIFNKNYIGALIQLNNKDILFSDKKNSINLVLYKNEKKNIFLNEIIQPKIKNKTTNTFILSFIEFEQSNFLTTSTIKHPLGENTIRIYKIEYINKNNAKLTNIKNFNGYSSAIFENNICKLEKQKIICIALNYYIKKNIIFNNSAILMINYEYLEITTILEINSIINSIFNFSLICQSGIYKKEYDYILITQNKNEDSDKTKKNNKDNFRFLDFYVFEPKYEYEPLLKKEKRIVTKSTIDITNSFILNKNNLVIFQTDQINIFSLSIK